VSRAIWGAIRLVLVAVASAAFAGACDSSFEPSDRITDFRLLAVSADKPFAAPGETIHLTALHQEPFGRPVTWAWTTCPLPRDSTVNACLARLVELAQAGAAPPFVIEPAKTTFDVVLPPNLLDSVPPAARANATVGVVTVACPGDLSLQDLAGLRAGALPFRCREAGSGVDLPFERYVVAVKRIYLYNRDKNQNPVIGGVTWDGAPWPENEIREARVCEFESNSFGDCKGETHEIGVEAPPGTEESGTSEYGTPFREDVVIQHFATEGVFEFAAKTFETPKTRWAARRQTRGQTVRMWFVLRDNRGGVTWTIREVKVP
jgi:hypothetical protein